MKWNESLSVGIQEIDEQHIRLFELISKAEAIESNYEEHELHDEIVRMLVKLNLYTIYHFETEERLLELNGYDELPAHKKEHVKFIEALENMHPEQDELKSLETLHEIVRFLEKWIENHIKKTDFLYSDLLKQKIVDGTFVANRKVEPFVFPAELEDK